MGLLGFQLIALGMVRAFISYGVCRLLVYTQLTLSYLLLAFSMENAILQEPYDIDLQLINLCEVSGVTRGTRLFVSHFSTVGLYNLVPELVYSRTAFKSVACFPIIWARWSV